MISALRPTNWVLRGVFHTVCRIDQTQLEKIPMQGPLILVANHINFLEAPIILPHLYPRKVVGVAKRETWNNPLFRFLFNQWGAIPIDRGVVDREAFHRSLDVLARGDMLAVAPEGTRSGNGSLLQAKPGIVALALKSGAPLLPVAFYGHEDFWGNFKRLRRTGFNIVVGRPFRINSGAEGMQREARQEITDEIMFKIAALLPERYHGYYQGARSVQYRYLMEL